MLKHNLDFITLGAMYNPTGVCENEEVVLCLLALKKLCSEASDEC